MTYEEKVIKRGKSYIPLLSSPSPSLLLGLRIVPGGGVAYEPTPPPPPPPPPSFYLLLFFLGS